MTLIGRRADVLAACEVFALAEERGAGRETALACARLAMALYRRRTWCA